MTAPDVATIEIIVMKLQHVSSCCYDLGRGKESDDLEQARAMYFVGDGIEAIRAEIRGWLDVATEAEAAAGKYGPRAVS